MYLAKLGAVNDQMADIHGQMLSLQEEEEELERVNTEKNKRVQQVEIINERLRDNLTGSELLMDEITKKYDELKSRYNDLEKKQPSNWNKKVLKHFKRANQQLTGANQQLTAENRSLRSRLAAMQIDLDHKDAQVQTMLRTNMHCPLCQDAPACYATLCGHLVACDSCVININQLNGRCPICRNECLSCEEGQPDLLRLNL